MTSIHHRGRAGTLLIAAILAFVWVYAACAAPLEPAARQAAEPATAPAEGIETVVIFRHGEKPATDLGQMTPQGLNRALALSELLPRKFGKPDYVFAPDPARREGEREGSYYYVRPLATVEPLAIRLEMPVQTPCGYKQIAKLEGELNDPRYANAMVFVCWEHVFAQRLAVDLVNTFHGDTSGIPEWAKKDYDSLYVVKIRRAPGKPPTATFSLEHEGLDGQSSDMPSPARK